MDESAPPSDGIGSTTPAETRLVVPSEGQASPSGQPNDEPWVPGPGCLAAVGWVVLLTMLQVAYVMPFVTGAATNMGSEPVVMLTFGTFGQFLAAVLIVRSQYGQDVWRAFAIRLPGRTPTILILLLVLPLTMVLGELSAWTAEGLRLINYAESTRLASESEVVDRLREYPVWLAVVLAVVFGGLFPALGEELFFRGFLGRGLVARWGPIRGVLLTSVLFGLLHVYPLSVVNAVLMGVVLHAVYLWTRSLMTPVLLHAVYNGLAFFIDTLHSKAGSDLNVDEHSPLMLAVAAFAATGGLLMLLFQSRVRWMTSDGSEWSPGFLTAEAPPLVVDARPAGRALRRVPVVAVVVIYLLLLAALGWELSR